MDKLYRLQVMHQQWSACRACQYLCHDRKNVVFGYGQYEKHPLRDANNQTIGFGAQVLIVGEAPGVHEDEQGLPFVGKSGALLDQYLASVSARPEVIAKLKEFNETKDNYSSEKYGKELRALLTMEVFFTNVVACRPPENRDPTPGEIAACRPRLLEIVYTVDPVVIIGVGRIAVESLLGRKISITQVRGEIFDISIPGKAGGNVTYPLIATLHPSYLMRRNDFNQSGGDGEKTYRDFLKAMNIVDAFNENHHSIPRPPLRPREEG